MPMVNFITSVFCLIDDLNSGQNDIVFVVSLLSFF